MDEETWFEIPLLNMRKAIPNNNAYLNKRLLYYGVNNWKHVPAILKTTYLFPSEDPVRNAGGSDPNIWGDTYDTAEYYATPHKYDKNYLQVQFRIVMLHSKTHKTEQMFKTKYTEAVELTHLRLRHSGPPKKYHLSITSPTIPKEEEAEERMAKKRRLSRKRMSSTTVSEEDKKEKRMEKPSKKDEEEKKDKKKMPKTIKNVYFLF